MYGIKDGNGRIAMKRYKEDFYDEEYFTGSSKSNYGKLNPDGGYTKDVYLSYKAQQGKMIFEKLDYTFVWKPDNILVMGCAVGYLVNAIHDVVKCECHGVDISEYAINRGTSEGIKDLHIGDFCERLPFKDKEFEVVISLENLEHIPEDDGQLSAAIDEHVRLCNTYLVISTPKKTDDEDDPSHFSVKDENWWVNEIEKRGLKTLEQVDAGDSVLLFFEVV